jgi:hypothetical protein
MDKPWKHTKSTPSLPQMIPNRYSPTKTGPTIEKFADRQNHIKNNGYFKDRKYNNFRRSRSRNERHDRSLERSIDSKNNKNLRTVDEKGKLSRVEMFSQID